LVAAGVVYRDGARVEREDATDIKPTLKKGRMKKTEIKEADAA
jgi:hypothetical protein